MHTSVLLNEVVTAINPKVGDKIIDCTLGFAGHTKEFLKAGAKVLGIDQDLTAMNQVRALANDSKLRLAHGNFRDLSQIAIEHEFSAVEGILFDLGVSSMQFDKGERGFSFNEDAPLDMRMDQSSSIPTAAEIINSISESDLFRLLVEYSQEKNAAKIAKLIVSNRPIASTQELALIIESSIKRTGKIHPATLTFQTLRMAVNQEIESLGEALTQAFNLLKPGGKIAVISFHETEDRLVKRRFQTLVNQELADNWSKKPIIPSEVEVKANPRSRSAKLRVIIKR